MRLSKTQKHAIQWMVSQDSNMKDIAKELKIPEKTVVLALLPSAIVKSPVAAALSDDPLAKK